MALFAPLPAPLARSRLKSNLGALALLIFARTLFTPYLALRAAVVGLVDSLFADPRGKSWDWMWWIESIVALVLLYNIAEAAYWVQHPQPAIPPTPRGLKLVPVLKSSPLTRSYPATPDLGTNPLTASTSAPSGSTSTPLRGNQQSPLAQSLYRSTPTRPIVAATRTPERPTGSPALSASTARALNLSQNGLSSSTGLFYDDTTSSSPSKVARGAAGTAGASPPKAAASRSDFVVVDREQREWVDNVWKGVRGKGRKVGL